MQVPEFAARGLDLNAYHPATINVDLSPMRVAVRDTALRFENVTWCDEHPPETFSFSACKVVCDGTEYPGMVYYPHPETKKDHFQGDSIIEVLAPLIPEIRYGARITLIVGDDIVLMAGTSDGS
jgi:hypothetical protein